MTGPAGPENTGEAGHLTGGGGSRSTAVPSLEQERQNERMELLIQNGAHNYLASDPELLSELVKSNLSDTDMLMAWIDGFTEIQAHEHIEAFKEHADDHQRNIYNTFNPLTQDFLKSYGYKLPHDHLDWWNPGDWAQLAQKKFSSQRNIPLAIVTAPGWAIAQTTQGVSDTIKMGWQAIEHTARFSERMYRAGIDAAKSETAKGRGELYNPLNWWEGWQNAEFHGASFTTESKDKALDLLGDQKHFDIMISIRRYGSVEQGLHEYFLSKNGNDSKQAISDALDFLGSGVIVSDEWNTAQEILNAGTTQAMQHTMQGWESMVREVPQYFGGLRGQPDAPMEDASRIWVKGQMVSGFGAEMLGSMMFEPFNHLDIYLTMRRMGKKVPGVTAGNWVEQIDRTHLQAASYRAYEQAKAGEDLVDVVLRSRVTNGMLVDADVGVKANFKQWAQDRLGDDLDWLRGSSGGIRAGLTRVNDEVDFVNNAFRAHIEWRMRSVRAAGNGEDFREADPMIRMLTDRNPAYMDAIPLMLRYHEDAVWGRYSGVDDVGEGAELVTGRLGLDTYDGYWEFYRTVGGAQVLGGRLLGGYQGEKLFLPNLGYTAKARLRLAGLKRGLLDRGDRVDEVPGIWAETFSHFIATETDIIIGNLYDNLQGYITQPNLFPEIAEAGSLHHAAFELTRFELQKLLTDPEHYTQILLNSGYAKYEGLAKTDIDILLNLANKQGETNIQRLEGIYRHIQGGGSLDDLPENLILSDDLMDVLRTRWPDISSTFVYWDDLPGPKGLSHPKWLDQGIQYVKNRRLGYLHQPGSSEDLLLRKFPERIVRIGEKTWEELLQMGYDVGPYRTNLRKAGYTNPKQLLEAIDEFSIREVAEQVGLETSELKWFLKNRLHTAVSENKFYDAAGKIKDSVLVGLYTGAAFPFKIHESIFRLTPKKKWIDVQGLGMSDAAPIRDFEALIRQGVLAGMPRQTIDWYISRFAHGDEATRWGLVNDVVTEFLGRGGALRYGGKHVKASWDKFVRGADMIYGNTGADQFMSRHRMTPRAITPALASEGYRSQANVIPNWHEIGEMTKYMGYMRHLGYNLGRAQVDTFFQKHWVPWALFKHGLAIRNAVDELLIATLNHGAGFYIDAKLSKAALNQTKIFDAYGNRIILDKDALIGTPPLRTDDVVAAEHIANVQREYEAAVNYSRTEGTRARNLWATRGINWVFKNFLDTLTVGRGKASNAKARDIAKKHPMWPRATDAEKEVLILEAAAERAGNHHLSAHLRTVNNFAERVSHDMAGLLHAGANALPFPFEPFNEAAARLLRRNDARNFHAARLLVAHPFTASPHLEGILTPFKGYYDITQRPNVAQLLGSQSIADPTVLDWMKLDYSDSALAWRFPQGIENDPLSNLQAAGQHMQAFWADEPVYAIQARVVAHNIGPDFGPKLDDIVKKLGIKIDDDLELTATQNQAKSARYIYELMAGTIGDGSNYHLRELIRTYYIAEANSLASGGWRSLDAFFPQGIDWNSKSAADKILQSISDPNAKAVLAEIFAMDTVSRQQTLAWLSIRDLDPRLMDTDINVLYARGVEDATNELITVDGIERLHAMARTHGVDPIFAQMQRATTPDQLRLWHPQANVFESMGLSYMFMNPGTPVADKMFDSLKEFLTFYLESDDLAVSVIHSLNPANNPHGSVLPTKWLETYVPGATVALAPGAVAPSPQAVNIAIQGFLANITDTRIVNMPIPLLVGSHNPHLSKKVGLAVRRWYKWLAADEDFPVDGIRAILEKSKETADDILLESRIVSFAEYDAQPSFGQTFSVTAGNRIPISNIGGPESNPPRIFVQGSMGPDGQWMSTTDLPTRWSAVPDPDAPAGETWELASRTRGTVRDEKRVIDRREYLESQIINSMRGFETLPDETVVQYFFSPSMSNDPMYENVFRYHREPVPSQRIAPIYDEFGARMERLIDLFNEYSDGTHTWGQFEEAIWRRFGDAPVTAKKGIGPQMRIEESRDFIGTVGEGPIGEHGFRRIFDHHKESDIIPSRRLTKEPIGDINDFPGRDKLPIGQWLRTRMQSGSALEGESFGQPLTGQGRRSGAGRHGARGTPEGTVDVPESEYTEFLDDDLRGTLAEYQAAAEQLTAHAHGQPVEAGLKDFFAWRQSLLNDNIEHIDSVWPFWEAGAVPEEIIIPPQAATWDDLKDPLTGEPIPEMLGQINAERTKAIADAKNAEVRRTRIERFFQESRETLEQRNVPIDYEVMRGGVVSPVERLVRSRMNNFPVADMPRNLWMWEPTLGRSVRPGDVGGFTKNNNPFVAVHAETVGLGFETVAGSGTIRLLNMYRHTGTGDFIWLRDGAELVLPSFRGVASRQIGPAADPSPVVTSVPDSVIPQQNIDARLDIGGADIELHPGAIDVPFEYLDTEIANQPPSPVDLNFRSKGRGLPEIPVYNSLDVKKQVVVMDHQYEMLLRGEMSGFAVPPQTEKGKMVVQGRTDPMSETLKARSGQKRPLLMDEDPEVGQVFTKLSKTRGRGPLTGVEEGDLLELRPRATYRKKPGPVEKKLIEEGRIKGAKRGRTIAAGGVPYPVRVKKVVNARTISHEDFAELVGITVEEVKANWNSGRNYSRYRVAMIEPVVGKSGWQKSHLNIDDPNKKSPRTRVMGDPGTSYSYTGKTFEPQPWSPMIAVIRDRIEQITGYQFDLVIAQRYDTFDTKLGAHFDRVGNDYNLPEEIVVSVNFGATRNFQFRPRRKIKSGERAGEGTGDLYHYFDDPTHKREPGPVIELHEGDILAMMKGTNANWEHQVLEGLADSGPRINLTFRRISEQTNKQVRFQDPPDPVTAAGTVAVHPSGLEKIISGGQNGADEAGLLAARELGIPTGGTATYRWDTTLGPKPEQAEQFGLVADAKDFPKAASRYGSRTRQNVVNSDGTVLFSENTTDAGSALTINIAEQLGKPLLHVSGTSDKAKAEFIQWLTDNNIHTLNVAGNRMWTKPGQLRRSADFQDRVHQFLLDALRSMGDLPVTAGTGTPPASLSTTMLDEATSIPENITNFDQFETWAAAELVAMPSAVRPEEAAWRALHLKDWPAADKASIEALAGIGMWDKSFQGLSYEKRPIWFARDTPEEWAQRQSNDSGMRNHDLHIATGPVGDTSEAAFYREMEEADAARGLFPDEPHVVEHLRRYGYSDEDIARLQGPPGAAPAAAADTGPVTVWAGNTPTRPRSNPELSNVQDLPGGFTFRGKTFVSPEAAYQAHKSGLRSTTDSATGRRYDKEGYDLSEPWVEMKGWTAKDKGRGRRVDMSKGPTDSVHLMEEIVDARLMQDSKFIEALAATGDRRILHPSNDIWETEYPRILMERRRSVQEAVNSDRPPVAPVSRTAKEEMDSGEWELVEQQYLGPHDEMNAAEHFARTSFREVMFLGTNENKTARAARAGGEIARMTEPSALPGLATDLPEGALAGTGAGRPDSHYSWLLEAIDPPGGTISKQRILQIHNPDYVPDRISGKAPVTAARDKPRWDDRLKRSFFESQIQPMITAMIREPLYFHNFKEALNLMDGYRVFFHHELNRFAGLDEILRTPLDGLVDELFKKPYAANLPRPVMRQVSDGGKTQWRLFDESSERLDESVPKRRGQQRSNFDDFLEFEYQNLVRMEQDVNDPASRMAHLLAQYFDNVTDTSRPDAIDKMFYLDRRTYHIHDGNTPLYLPDGSPLLGEIWDLGPFYKLFGSTGVPGEGFERFFDAIRMNNAEDYSRLKRGMVELMAGRIQMEVKHAELAIERAAGVTSKFVDNHALRTQFQAQAGTAIPFFFAQLQFLQRWGRTLKYHPNALSKMNWWLLAAQRSGYMFTDTRDEQRVMIPGTEWTTQFTFETMAKFPLVRRIFGDIAVMGDDYTMRNDRLSPGYDLDNIANITFGPMISLPSNLFSMIDPKLASDEWMGPSLVSQWAFLSEGLDTSGPDWDAQSFWRIAFGSVLPAPIVNVGTVITSLIASNIFGASSGAGDKAFFDAVYMTANNGWLPDPIDMTDLSRSEHDLLNQDTLNAFYHLGNSLMLIRGLTGSFGPTRMDPASLVDPKDWEWNENFQKLIDEGATHEEAFSTMYEEYFDQFVAEQTALGKTEAEILRLWQPEILKISVFSTGKTGKDTIAALPQTVAAMEWLDTPGNTEFLNNYPKVGGFFIPRGVTEESREYDMGAINRYIGMNMRFRQDPEEWITGVYVHEGAMQYYPKSLEHKQRMAEYRAAEKQGLPNYVNPGESWAQTKLDEQKIWDTWEETFKNFHPIFAASLVEQYSGLRRDDALEEMAILMANVDQIPDTTYKNDIVMFMNDILKLNSALRAMAGITDRTATARRNSIKKKYYEHVQNFIVGSHRKPWLFELYNNLFIPLIEESWIVKYDAGTHAYEE